MSGRRPSLRKCDYFPTKIQRQLIHISKSDTSLICCHKKKPWRKQNCLKPNCLLGHLMMVEWIQMGGGEEVKWLIQTRKNWCTRSWDHGVKVVVPMTRVLENIKKKEKSWLFEVKGSKNWKSGPIDLLPILVRTQAVRFSFHSFCQPNESAWLR